MSETTQEQAPANQAAEAGKSTATPTPTPTPSVPAMVHLPAEEYQRYRGLESQLNEIRRANEAAIEKERSEKIKATTDKDELAKLLKEQREASEAKLNEARSQYLELETQTFAERKAAVVAQALAGRTFVSPEAAKQVEALIASNIEVVRNADKSLSVRDKTSLRPAADVLKETLDSPAFAHFLAASNTTGGAGQQGDRSGQQKDAPAPGSVEAIAGRYAAAQGKYAAMGLAPVSRK